jgi:hypothetical protein
MQSDISIGCRHMIFRGYLHRDISIGNMLFCEEPMKKRRLRQELQDTNTPQENFQFIEKLGIDEDCYGCLIDGDSSVVLKKYLVNPGNYRLVVRFVFVSDLHVH